ncbi:MAG: 4-(cytidine 5'-diphospho)-2-C-methyl-D-erythritol kinase, partial [Candidatus Omnitrophica bacterium]|nr:4-(cytidine 5'-diphospho)-2-C-methyl-D-erythritol kinase [Candidatus Omnitrophota bacterium]
MKSVTLPSYAKVNLHLRVLGKRPDGAHELLTLFERIDLSDELTVSGIPGHRIEVECDSPEVPTDASNLAFKAAEGFRQALGLEEGLRISLKKQIPVAGGLGGGSSNAAATLLALQRLFGSPLPHEKLLRAAAALG